jgi:ribonuclease inhibitor
MKIVIESKEIQTINDFHIIIKEKLNLPDYYGQNLDALWDCFTGYIDLPIQIEIIDHKNLLLKLGETGEKLFKFLRKAEIEIDGFKIVLR